MRGLIIFNIFPFKKKAEIFLCNKVLKIVREHVDKWTSALVLERSLSLSLSLTLSFSLLLFHKTEERLRFTKSLILSSKISHQTQGIKEKSSYPPTFLPNIFNQNLKRNGPGNAIRPLPSFFAIKLRLLNHVKKIYRICSTYKWV